MFKVYEVVTDDPCYAGALYIGAEDAEEANKLLAEFIKSDYANSGANLDAVEKCKIDERDAVEYLIAKRKGVVLNNLVMSY